ncbi:MAG: hypothetical protein RL701_1199 [Pseudomonadota bacterium]
MRALITWCLEQRWVVICLAALLLLLGARSARHASFDAFPEFAPPRVEIQTEAPGLSSEEVEALITLPIESALSGLPGLEQLRSKSVLGLGSIVLLFKPRTDLMQARIVVQERLARVVTQLPMSARTPVILTPLSSTSRVLKIGLWGKQLSQMELSDVARWVVRPRLLSIRGVANVAIWGERDRQLQVKVDPERLAAQGIGMERVVGAVRAAVTPHAGGFIDSPNQRLPVIHPALVQNAADLARVPLTFANPLSLGQVADVSEGHPPAIGDGLVTQGRGVLLIVEKQRDGNTLEITRDVDAALAALAPALHGVEVDASIFRPASFIERALHNLGEAIGIGCVLVIAVLFLFLWDARTALVSVTALPLSLFAATTVLTALGYSIDTMVIAGLALALGEVVDDAIIDVENIHRRLTLERAHGPIGAARTLQVIVQASFEVRSAIVYASMIVLLVFVPVLFLDGVAGAFFRPLALAYGLAVLASTFVALTVTPALACVLFERERDGERHSPLAAFCKRRYGPLLTAVLARPRRMLLATACVFVVTCWAFAGLREQFLPAFQESDFLMHWIARPSTSLAAVTRTADLARAELLRVPGVRNFGAHIARAELGDEVVGPNFAELWISVDPKADLAITLERVRSVVDGYPGVYRDVQTYLQERMREVLSGGSGAIVVRLYGPDLAQLRSSATELAATLEQLEGIAHARPEAQALVPQIEVKPDLERCAALGIDPGLVRARVSSLVQGERVGQLVRGQQPIDVVVTGSDRTHNDVTALRDLSIQLDDLRTVRLGDIASVRITPMQNAIAHDAGSRKLDVVIDLDAAADLGAIAARIERVVAGFSFAPGHYAELLGEYRARSQARAELGFVAALALIGIALVLWADFQSLRLTLLVLASLPFALVGGVLAAVATGGVVSLGTLIGLITVIGIAARNGIMLITHYRHLELVEALPFSRELVMRGASERLAPILMTALATSLALVPLVIGGAAPGHEIEHPMAVVILGGVASSTVLNLLIMPVLYLRYSRKH